MSRLKPLRVIDQAELAMRAALSRRKWKDCLPSFITLSGFLGVSVPTVSLVVARLAKAGLVASQGKRRRYRIKSAAHRAPLPEPGLLGRVLGDRYLLVAGNTPRDQLDAWSGRLVMEAIRELRRIEWVCDYEMIPFGAERPRVASWDRVLASHPATHLLVLDGTPPVVKWARARGLNVALLGGQRMAGVLSLGVDLEQVLSLVVGKLARLGHRKVMVPVSEGFPALARAVAQVACRPLGFTPDQMLDRGLVSCLRVRTPAEHRRALAELISRLRPTALVCISWRDYLVAADVARELGMAIPRDISMVVLDSNPDMEWVKPLPSRFSLGPEVVVANVVEWVLSARPDVVGLTNHMLSGWVEGETMAAPASRSG